MIVSELIIKSVNKIANAICKRKGYTVYPSLENTRVNIEALLLLMEAIKNDELKRSGGSKGATQPKKKSKSKGSNVHQST